MDTKWRKFSTSLAMRILVLLLAVTAITAAVLQIPLANSKGITECLWVKDYQYSKAFKPKLLKAFDQVLGIKYNKPEPKNPAFFYYVKYGNKECSNTDVFYENYEEFYGSAIYRLKDGQWIEIATGAEIITSSFNKGMLAYVVFPDTYFLLPQSNWDKNRRIMYFYFLAGVGLALFGILLIIYLSITAGRSTEDNKIHLAKVDWLYSDISISLLCILIYFFARNAGDIFRDNIKVGIGYTKHGSWLLTRFQDNLVLSIMIYAIFIAFFTGMAVVLLLSLIRKAKAGVLIRHSLIYVLGCEIYKEGKSIYEYIFYEKLYPNASLTQKLYCRQMLMIVLTALCFLFTLLFAALQAPLIILPIILQIITIGWYIQGNKPLYSGIDQGILDSMEEQMKSERMKVALITNVSHDLKTPLTSIISYTELLSKEEGLSVTAVDYVKILQAKSERMKNIVTDLFDLAKSTSGDISLEFETIDLKKLIEQTLADLEDNIYRSELKFKVKLPDTPIYIKSDGRRLYRVFQNVIDNVLMYSMKNTRVYITMEITDNKAVIVIKNISAYEMNFTSEEILQRFYRGDPSRTQEGSGLGLSIAESFTKNCGGEFAVEIDGDIFKVILTFNQIKD